RRRRRNGSCAVPAAKLSYRCALAMQERTLFACAGPVAVAIGPYNVVIRAPIETVEILFALLVLLPFFCFSALRFLAAKRVPLPRPRPAEIARPEPPAEASAEEPAPSSACRLRLTAELAVAPSLPALIGPGECNVEDVVRLEAVWLADRTRVAVTPPAILRCSFAEAIVQWVRQ